MLISIIVSVSLTSVIKVTKLGKYHAFRLWLATHHGVLHVDLFLVCLCLHVLEKLLSVRLLEDSASLLLFFFRLKEYSTEDLSRDSLMETIRNKLRELVELLLLVLRMLCFLDESDNFFLDFFRQIQVVHRCVHCIDLFLEDDGLLVDIIDQHSQLTEQVCLRDGTHDICYRNENQLLVVTGTEIISEQEKATCIEAYTVFVGVRLVKEGSSVIPAPDVIEGRYPFLFTINDVEPNARNEVNVHQQEKYQLHQFY